MVLNPRMTCDLIALHQGFPLASRLSIHRFRGRKFGDSSHGLLTAFCIVSNPN